MFEDVRGRVLFGNEFTPDTLSNDLRGIERALRDTQVADAMFLPGVIASSMKTARKRASDIFLDVHENFLGPKRKNGVKLADLKGVHEKALVEFKKSIPYGLQVPAQPELQILQDEMKMSTNQIMGKELKVMMKAYKDAALKKAYELNDAGLPENEEQATQILDAAQTAGVVELKKIVKDLHRECAKAFKEGLMQKIAKRREEGQKNFNAFFTELEAAKTDAKKDAVRRKYHELVRGQDNVTYKRWAIQALLAGLATCVAGLYLCLSPLEQAQDDYHPAATFGLGKAVVTGGVALLGAGSFFGLRAMINDAADK